MRHYGKQTATEYKNESSQLPEASPATELFQKPSDRSSFHRSGGGGPGTTPDRGGVGEDALEDQLQVIGRKQALAFRPAVFSASTLITQSVACCADTPCCAW